ncbi:multi antimicrobial extrusion protein [Gracilibacillus boraciitolerans JCM 21714]|uniref:Multi antimicrobial extrusion protein n=1 Tax=Gracilibacillus boraciitolerans JCM 21714 TaxID=1298598 RepID=W4VLF9_9BACI|nr:MATE family efflux transporter [Gracilibacillus boraciitolerans]GAE93609.1 multi antimicrobial extrusion protein [Gracilibacillus boraciitolerans JCM 21714]
MKQTDTKKLSLFALTWPIFIEILLHMLMGGNADTLMLSQYSDHSVAAVGVSNQVLSVVIVMFGFVAAGGASILVAQNLGAEQPKTAGKIAVTSISLNLWFSLALSIILFVFSDFILRLMDLPEELMDEASTYMNIVGGFMFIQALIMTVAAILRSYGYTKDTMYVTIGMNILNVIGNYFVIFGPYGFPVLGVEGVAYVTMFSRFIGFIILLFILVWRSNRQLPFSAFFRYEKKHVKSLMQIGIPSAGEQLSYNTSQMAITYFIAQMGTIALTTKVYVQNLMMFILLFSIAIGQGTQILIGHMIGGAGDMDKAYHRCVKSLKIAILISTIMAILFYSFSPTLLGIFTNDTTIIEKGMLLLLVTIILEPGRAFNLVVINSLRAAGDVKFPVVIGIASMWGGISVIFAWFFGIFLGLGLIGVWIAFIADEWLRGILMLRRWRSKIWMQKAFVKKEVAE